MTREDAGPRPVVARSAVDRGRLTVYAAVGASLSAVPLPWLPDSLLRRVRGALVHDVAVRHGLSLTREARDVLSEPSGPDGPSGLLTQAVRFLGGRIAMRTLTRFGPVEEARRVRPAVEGALARALTTDGGVAPEPTIIDDQRDALTALIDGLIGLVAGVPNRLVRRLDAAFDDLLTHGHG